MKRGNPFISPIGLGLSVILFLFLGAILWRQGGLIFSPGKVSAKTLPGVTLAGFSSHAEFEEQCKLCHRPLETTQDILCMECHTSISEQLATNNGAHAQMEDVSRCAACHSDHQGRDFDPTAAALLQFDHSVTTFSLDQHQFDYAALPLNCDACHSMGDQFTLNEDACQTCHRAHDQAFMAQHDLDFGQDCLGCHDGLDTMARFNHRETEFPLDGKHTQVNCADCHIDGQFEGVSPDCAACHQEPDLHRGMFDPQCADCHTTMAWSPAIIEGMAFDHSRDSNFSLVLHGQNFDNTPLTCVACHPQGIRDFSLDQCVQCHTVQDADFMNEHQFVFGSACLDCHDGVDRMSDFDHANVFVLDGRHADIACESCHAEKNFRGTPTECAQCHEEPQIHVGVFGLQCQNCHTATAWQPARMTAHTFPLDHGESGQVACDVCHVSSYVEYTCYGCHEHQPDAIANRHTEEGISSQELSECTQCHPTGEEDESD